MNRVTFFPFLFPIVLIMEKLEQENLLESNWKYKKKSTFICYAKFFLHHHHHIIRPIACSVTCICFKARVHTYSRPCKCTGTGNKKKDFLLCNWNWNASTCIQSESRQIILHFFTFNSNKHHIHFEMAQKLQFFNFRVSLNGSVDPREQGENCLH